MYTHFLIGDCSVLDSLIAMAFGLQIHNVSRQLSTKDQRVSFIGFYSMTMQTNDVLNADHNFADNAFCSGPSLYP